MSRMGRQGIVWRTPDVTADGLKIFACITMLLQNIGVIVVQKGMIGLDQYTQESLKQAMSGDSHLMMLAGIGSLLQLAGGLAVPVFAFLLVEGFLHTSSYRKYLLSVAGISLISEIPYDLAMTGKLWDFSSQNALVSMVICLMMLYYLRMVKDNLQIRGNLARLLIVTIAVFWAALFRAQYGLCMVLLTAVFYVFYSRNVLKTILGILVSLLYVTGPISFYGIWCYNEVRNDKYPKYMYYVFYPLHLAILGVIAGIAAA